MKNCVKCGKEISDDAKFCSYCGTKQEEAINLTLENDEDISLSKVAEELSKDTEELKKDTTMKVPTDDDLTVSEKKEEDNIELKLDPTIEPEETVEETVAEETKEETPVEEEEKLNVPETTVWGETNSDSSYTVKLRPLTLVIGVLAIIYFVIRTINDVISVFDVISGYYDLYGVFDEVTTFIAYLGYVVCSFTFAVISIKIISSKNSNYYLTGISGLAATCEIHVAFGLFEYICARIVGYSYVIGLPFALVMPIIITAILYYFIKKNGASDLEGMELVEIFKRPFKWVLEAVRNK